MEKTAQLRLSMRVLGNETGAIIRVDDGSEISLKPLASRLLLNLALNLTGIPDADALELATDKEYDRAVPRGKRTSPLRNRCTEIRKALKQANPERVRLKVDTTAGVKLTGLDRGDVWVDLLARRAALDKASKAFYGGRFDDAHRDVQKIRTEYPGTVPKWVDAKTLERERAFLAKLRVIEMCSAIRQHRDHAPTPDDAEQHIDHLMAVWLQRPDPDRDLLDPVLRPELELLETWGNASIGDCNPRAEVVAVLEAWIATQLSTANGPMEVRRSEVAIRDWFSGHVPPAVRKLLEAARSRADRPTLQAPHATDDPRLTLALGCEVRASANRYVTLGYSEERWRLTDSLIDLAVSATATDGLASDDPSSSFDPVYATPRRLRTHPWTVKQADHFLAQLLPLCGVAPDEDGDGVPSTVEGEGASEPSEARRRFVLIGQPGSGKSTLMQILCQVLRAAWLRDQAAVARLSAEVAAEVSLIERAIALAGLPAAAPALPFHIKLTEFSRYLARRSHDGMTDASAASDSRRADEQRTLFGFLAQKLSELLPDHEPIDSATVRRWLLTSPVVLVFDGLDEVPATSNRNAVQDELEDAVAGIADANVNLVVVVTTRPQGYAREFDPAHFRHLWLRPLSAEAALAYGGKLAAIRHPGDSKKQDEVTDRLQRAAAHPVSQRLMRTPLNVTFMTLLVETMRSLPGNRWALYSGWYHMVLRREQLKDNDFTPVLQKYSDEIESIHSEVAVALHGRAERSQIGDEQMSLDEFTAIARRELRSKVADGDELAAVVSQVTRAAEERIVLLVGIRAGEVGFDHQTLREFMAAKAVKATSDTIREECLLEIVRRPFWHTVALFCAEGLAGSKWTRDSIIRICIEANHGPADVPAHIVRRGSQMAAALAAETQYREYPGPRRSLTGIACNLLDSPSPEGAKDLIVLATDDSALVLDEIRERLQRDPAPPGSHAAWACLTALRGTSKGAEALFAQLRPRSLTEQRDLHFRRVPGVEREEWESLGDGYSAVEWLLSVARQIPAGEVAALAEADEFTYRALGSAGDPLTLLPLEFGPQPPRLGDIEIRVSHATDTPSFGAHIESVDAPDEDARDALAALREAPEAVGLWAPLTAALTFAADPGRSALATSLGLWVDYAKDHPEWAEERRRWSNGPWPLCAVLRASTTVEALQRHADAAAAGKLGDWDDWKESEEMWAGHTLDATSFMVDPSTPFAVRVGAGFPWMTARYRPALDAEAMLDIWRSSSGERAHALAYLLGAAGEQQLDDDVRLSPSELLRLWGDGAAWGRGVEALSAAWLLRIESSAWDPVSIAAADDVASTVRLKGAPSGDWERREELYDLVARSGGLLLGPAFLVAASNDELALLAEKLPRNVLDRGRPGVGLNRGAGSALLLLREPEDVEIEEAVREIAPFLDAHDLLEAWFEAVERNVSAVRVRSRIVEAMMGSKVRRGEVIAAFAERTFHAGIGPFSSTDAWKRLTAPRP